MQAPEHVRLDKWLWAVRLYKSRSLATTACNGGHVKIGGNNAKPSRDVHVGDTILVEKAGDIIPQIVRVTEKAQTTHPQSVFPTVCPTCGTGLYLDADEVNLWCPNAACPAKLERNVLHYLECIGVMGIGSGIVEKVGRKVKGFRRGDHVVLSYQSCGQCRPCRQGRPGRRAPGRRAF